MSLLLSTTIGYLVSFVIICIFAIAGVFVGINLRKRANDKKINEDK